MDRFLVLRELLVIGTFFWLIDYVADRFAAMFPVGIYAWF